jgi:hypothetical protein
VRRKWRDEARLAIAELEGVSHGSRETVMQAIAGRLSGHTDTSAMRRAIAAHNFLEQLRGTEPASYAQLENAPLSVVEVIARWFVFDRPAALAAAEEWARGIGNVTSITKAMRDARPPGYAGKSGIALEKAYVLDAKPIVSEAVHKLTGLEVTLSGTSVRDDATGQTLDFIFDLPGGTPKRQVAVLVVGPYTNTKLYSNKCADWVTKAFGLALLFERIVLALPEANALAEYQRRTEAVRKRIGASSQGRSALDLSACTVPTVDVVHTDVPKVTAEEAEILAQWSGLRP